MDEDWKFRGKEEEEEEEETEFSGNPPPPPQNARRRVSFPVGSKRNGSLEKIEKIGRIILLDRSSWRSITSPLPLLLSTGWTSSAFTTWRQRGKGGGRNRRRRRSPLLPLRPRRCGAEIC